MNSERANRAVTAVPTTSKAPSGPAFHWPLSAMRKELFRKGECLFKVGDKADRMFYLHRGAVWLPEIKKTIPSGQVIGELGLFSPRSERTASAICQEDLEVYSMGRDEVLQFFKEDPSLAIDLIQFSFKRFIEHERAEAERQERLQSELRIAREIQTSMLPHTLPAAALRQQVEITASIQPAKEVGGDFYDYFMTGSNKLCVLIGDASGKGVPAALFVAVGRSLLKAEAMRGSRPHQILARVNRLLCPDNPLCMFITLLCFSLNTRTGEMECCNAGHERPMLCKPDGPVDLIDLPRGMAIGVMEDARYQSRKIRLNPGETLFSYTDGVSDAINPQQQCFTQKRLVECLETHRAKDPAGMLERLKKAIEDYTEAEPQADDITLAAVKFLGRPVKATAPRVGI